MDNLGEVMIVNDAIDIFFTTVVALAVSLMKSTIQQE